MKIEKNLKSIGILLFLLAGSFSFAGYKSELSERIKQFENEAVNTGNTTVEMTDAAEKYYKNVDDELNTVYKKLISELERKNKSKAKENLVKAQKNWIKQRDEEAKAVPREGSVTTINVYYLMAELTQKRALELAEMLDNLSK